jgi:hypothetical protein
MLSPEHIKHFVQNTLGCGCPEDVFKSIDVRRNVRVNSFIVLDSAIVIGNRLLVYIAEAGSAGCVEEHLPVLVAAGKKERDEKGLNRFRLVLVSDRPDEVRQAAERQFEELRGKDEKVHLHVITKSDILFTAETSASPVEPDAEGTEERGTPV